MAYTEFNFVLDYPIRKAAEELNGKNISGWSDRR